MHFVYRYTSKYQLNSKVYAVSSGVARVQRLRGKAGQGFLSFLPFLSFSLSPVLSFPSFSRSFPYLTSPNSGSEGALSSLISPNGIRGGAAKHFWCILTAGNVLGQWFRFILCTHSLMLINRRTSDKYWLPPSHISYDYSHRNCAHLRIDPGQGCGGQFLPFASRDDATAVGYALAVLQVFDVRLCVQRTYSVRHFIKCDLFSHLTCHISYSVSPIIHTMSVDENENENMRSYYPVWSPNYLWKLRLNPKFRLRRIIFRRLFSCSVICK